MAQMLKRQSPRAAQGDPDFAEARVMMIASMKLAGMTNREIGEQLGISDLSVGQIMTRGKKAGTLRRLKERVLDDLASKAVDIYAKHIEYQLAQEVPDLEAARDVLKGVGVLADGRSREMEEFDPNVEELHLIMRRAKQQAQAQVSPAEDIIEGKVVSDGSVGMEASEAGGEDPVSCDPSTSG
jgi:predicted transcriptional regulator